MCVLCNKNEWGAFFELRRTWNEKTSNIVYLLKCIETVVDVQTPDGEFVCRILWEPTPSSFHPSIPGWTSAGNKWIHKSWRTPVNTQQRNINNTRGYQMKRTAFNYRSFALSKKKYHKSEKRRLHQGELTTTPFLFCCKVWPDRWSVLCYQITWHHTSSVWRSVLRNNTNSLLTIPKAKVDFLQMKMNGYVYDLSPLHPNISMHILRTDLFTFPREQTRRICLTIKSFFSWLSFPLFYWP